MTETLEMSIYNKYEGKITCAFTNNIYKDDTGAYRINAKRTQEKDKYLFMGFKEDGSDNISLIECPIDVLAIEFEAESTEKKSISISTREDRDNFIEESKKKCTELKLDYCIADHGGTSKYLYLFNLKGLLINYERESKILLAKKIVSEEAQRFLDWSNLSKTLIPIIGRPHWKPKYNGAIHKIIDGKFPQEHDNDIRRLELDWREEINKKSQGGQYLEFEGKKLVDLIDTTSFKKNGNKLQGSHPIHGSTTGSNFCMDTTRDIWFCFRHANGGGILQYIAMKEGLIGCGDMQDLKGNLFKEVIKLAEEKYGVTVRKESSDFPKIYLPQIDRINVTEFINQVAPLLKKTNTFYRIGDDSVVEIRYGRLKIVKSLRMITLLEEIGITGIEVYNGKTFTWEFIKKSASDTVCKILLESPILHKSLRHIDKILNVPIPILKDDKLIFPKRGYNEELELYLNEEAPEIENLDMSLDEAKKTLYNIYKEFCFKTNIDATKALLALLTPFCRGLYKTWNTRTALFISFANRERTGKDCVAGIRIIVYEGEFIEDPPVSTGSSDGTHNEELRKKILAVLLAGKNFLHFGNNKGFINNSVLEQVVTANTWSDRLLGVNKLASFHNSLEISLSGNMGTTVTSDLANRSVMINLFLAMENANERKFQQPLLHQYVAQNRGLILSALYSLVRNWYNKGMPKSNVVFASFPEWASVCGGILESAGFENPLEYKDDSCINIDAEIQEMIKLYEYMFEKHPNEWMKKNEIKIKIREFGEEENTDIFAYIDFTDRSDQMKFSGLLDRYVGRELSNITMIDDKTTKKPSKRLFKFTQEKVMSNLDLKKAFKIDNLDNLDNSKKNNNEKSG